MDPFNVLAEHCRDMSLSLCFCEMMDTGLASPPLPHGWKLGSHCFDLPAP
jgi:hypothetical protein